MAYVAGPFDREHLYLQFGGALPGNEEWSCGLRLAKTEGIGGAVDSELSTYNVNALLDNVVAPISNYVSNGVAMFSNSVKLDFIKLNRIKKDGHYAEQVTNVRYITGISGAGSPRYPNQVAIAISLTTAVARGPANRGRFFMPLPVAAPAGDGCITTADADAHAGQAKILIEAISDVPGTDVASDPGVVVMSRKLGAPMTRRVSGISVGRVLDTQRRRRRSLPEGPRAAVVDQGVF